MVMACEHLLQPQGSGKIIAKCEQCYCIARRRTSRPRPSELILAQVTGTFLMVCTVWGHMPSRLCICVGKGDMGDHSLRRSLV